jgi:hypothetical protein
MLICPMFAPTPSTSMGNILSEATGRISGAFQARQCVARQVCRQGPAAAFLAFRFFSVRQSRVRKINASRLVSIGTALVCIPLKDGLLGFVEDAIHVFFAPRSKTMQLRKCQLLLKLEDALRKDLLLSLQHGDFGSIRRQKRHQLRNCRDAGSIHRILESKASECVNRRIQLSQQIGKSQPTT